MLYDIVLSSDEKHPQKIMFEELFNYTGQKKLKNVKSFKAKVDTSEMSLSYLGDFLPSLQFLRLDYSNIGNIRDLSTHLPKLKVLSITHCNLSSIEGIGTISCNIQELYLSYNCIDDISPLLDFNYLKILDLESNLIENVDDVSLLKCCNALVDLTIRGTRLSENPEYRILIKKNIPQLQVLDGIKYHDDNKKIEIIKETQSQLPQLSSSQPLETHQPAEKQDEKITKITKLPLLRKSNPIASSKKIKQPKIPKVWHNIGPNKL